MNQRLALEWMHDMWMMRSESLDQYAALAHDVLLGKTIPTGFFGSLTLPEVPKNIGLVVMNGPLSKSDVCGWKGSRSLSNEIIAAAKDNSIEAIILLSENCPGGQVDGTQALSDAVIAAKESKPVIGVVSGMACSAAYWALSNCNAIYATSYTDMAGCIGTLARLKNPKNSKEGDFIEIISDLSPDKNSETKDADKLKSSYLNPVTEIFHNSVKQGRGDALKLDKENTLSGKTYIAPQAKEHGLIDDIMPFEKVIKQTKKIIKANNIAQSNLQSNNTMNFSEKFPKLAALLAVSPEIETADLTVDHFLPKCEALESLAADNADKTALKAQITELKNSVTEKETSITSLTTERDGLQTKVSDLTTANGTLKTRNERLGNLTAGSFSNGDSEADKNDDTTDEDSVFETSFDREMKEYNAKAKLLK